MVRDIPRQRPRQESPQIAPERMEDRRADRGYDYCLEDDAMNEATFLIGLGFVPKPDTRGPLAAPPIIRNIWKEDAKWVHDRELDGRVRMPGLPFDEAKP